MKKGKAWLLLLVLVMGLLGSLGTAVAAGDAVQVGQKAPDFSSPLLDGSSFKLSDSLGKVVFVNVWASWCGPCASEVPDLQKLAEAYPGVQSHGQPVRNCKQFNLSTGAGYGRHAEQHGFPLPVYSVYDRH